MMNVVEVIIAQETDVAVDNIQGPVAETRATACKATNRARFQMKHISKIRTRTDKVKSCYIRSIQALLYLSVDYQHFSAIAGSKKDRTP